MIDYVYLREWYGGGAGGGKGAGSKSIMLLIKTKINGFYERCMSFQSKLMYVIFLVAALFFPYCNPFCFHSKHILFFVLFFYNLMKP